MPTYDYECTECEHRFEHRRSIHDTRIVKCPKCKAKAQQIIASVPVIFKGSGFYVTDHRKPGASDAASAPAPAKKTTADAKK